MPRCRAQVEYGIKSDVLDSSVSGSTKKYVQSYTNQVYVSGVMHHAKLEGLQPLTTYYYRRACVHLSTLRALVVTWALVPVCEHVKSARGAMLMQHLSVSCSVQAEYWLDHLHARSVACNPANCASNSKLLLLHRAGAAMQR